MLTGPRHSPRRQPHVAPHALKPDPVLRTELPRIAWPRQALSDHRNGDPDSHRRAADAQDRGGQGSWKHLSGDV